MKTKYVITALLLLSVAVMARAGGQQAGYPNGSPSRNQQPTAADMTQTTQASAPDTRDRFLEGCVAGTRDNLTLTDTAGKVYRLRGDTAKLADHIGQQASITGIEEPRSGSRMAESQPTFIVKKVAMIASVCSPSK